MNLADFKFGACIPETCSVGDIYSNYAKLYESINAVAMPAYEKSVTEDTKREKMDDFAISML